MATLQLLFCFIMVSSIGCDEKINDHRNSKFSIFQIIKFKNEPCVGSATRNGTCFTAAECESAGGTESSSCADGFGVCCVVILANGASTSLNQSYIVQSTSSTVTSGAMTYTICPCSSDVCRIRFDFTNFALAAPNTGLGADGGGAALTGGALGDCTTDQFTISSSGGGTPVICGTNVNQHMIVDSDGVTCAKANFGLGGLATSRAWDIMVTQYRCGEEAGGPPGCLQWHMNAAGSVRSFNFPELARGAVATDEIVHLSSQMYEICIRKPAGSSRICYTQCTVGAAISMNANMMDTFGIGLSANGAAANEQSALGTDCNTDWVQIIGGTTDAIATIGTNGVSNSRFCGRYLAPTEKQQGDGTNPIVSVCTATAPYRVGVNFDADEASGIANADMSEDAGLPSGALGFSICYTTPT